MGNKSSKEVTNEFVKAGAPDHSLSSACKTDSSTVTHKETVIYVELPGEQR